MRLLNVYPVLASLAEVGWACETNPVYPSLLSSCEAAHARGY